MLRKTKKKQPKEVVTAMKYSLSDYLVPERELFSSILKCLIEENVDFTMKRTYKWRETEYKITKDTYNEKIIIALAVTKRFIYLWRWKHLSYGELLFIRWLEKDRWNLKQYKDRYSNIENVPNIYNESFQTFNKRVWMTTAEMAEHIKKDLNKSSLHRYIKPIKFKEYRLCVSVFLNKLNKYYTLSYFPKIIVIKALIEFFKWFRIKEYMIDLYWGRVEDSLKYQTSFEKVLYSPKMKRNMWKSWDRFCDTFEDVIGEKFDDVIKKKA